MAIILLDTSVASLLLPDRARRPDRAGRRLEAGDAWIAATAIRHHLTLLSHDRDLKDLPVAGLNVISFA